ncbi:MAG: hypothetical protein HZB51_01425 [Chloroflexi bacterium]|nr:hypothetical protein [Chloroflexota bacterium]
MFKNRSFNIFVGLIIAVLAVLSIGTAVYNQQAAADMIANRFAPVDWYLNHDHAVPNDDESTVAPDKPVTSESVVPSNRIPSVPYLALKDHQLSQMDAGTEQVGAINLSSEEHYATLKSWQLEQMDRAASANQIGIAVTGSAKLSGSERYTNLKEAQLEQLDLNRSKTAMDDPYVPSVAPSVNN